MRKLKIVSNALLSLFFLGITISCVSTSGKKHESQITLTFAGDIMAHGPNVKGRFPEIYEDIKPILDESDLNFANFETPVTDSKPYSGYPFFNVKNEYAQAAIDAGFNVFSLANNHSNDQMAEGLNSTRDFFASKKNIYSAGIKNKNNDPLTYSLIEKDGWKILFVAVTELVNHGESTSLMDYYPWSRKSWTKLKEDLTSLKDSVEHDMFIVSFHNAEEEYVLSVEKSHLKLYDEIIELGADVLWINHAHVPKTWKVLYDENNIPRKIIFYGMGNTISAQRTKPSWDMPDSPRDYTGDGFLATVKFEKQKDEIRIKQLKPYEITTYITKDKFYFIRLMNDETIQKLRDSKETKWADYLSERKKIVDKIKGIEIWQ